MNRTKTATPWRLPGLLSALLLLAGCALTPDYQVPDTPLPPDWPRIEARGEKRTHDRRQWWTRYQDPELDRLLARTFQDNPDIRLQAARTQEARAYLGLARADQFPTVNLQAEAARERQPGTTAAIPDSGGSTYNLFSIAGVLNYELDIWGRLAMEEDAAEALLRQSVFAHEAVRLGVVADVATTYFSLSAARSDLAILHETLASRESTYELEKFRYEMGATSELTLRQAESELEGVRARIPPQVRQVRQLEGALGILVGLSPAELYANSETESTALAEIENPNALPEVLPSELLARRPDIAAAEAALAAAGANVGIARAERLPRVNLAAFLGTAALETGDLFTAAARTWGIGADLYGSLIDFGRNRALVASAEAILSQAQITYEATVKIAFNEVRDALFFYQSALDHEEAVGRQLAAAERTLALSERRYNEGLVGFLEFLDAQRMHLAARQAVNNAARDRLTATATLFKAMGGGWDPQAIDNVASASTGVKRAAPND